MKFPLNLHLLIQTQQCKHSEHGGWSVCGKLGLSPDGRPQTRNSTTCTFLLSRSSTQLFAFASFQQLHFSAFCIPHPYFPSKSVAALYIHPECCHFFVPKFIFHSSNPCLSHWPAFKPRDRVRIVARKIYSYKKQQLRLSHPEQSRYWLVFPPATSAFDR